MQTPIYDKIIFYDGSCGFCNKTVQFILKFEKNKTCYFAPIQSNFAQDFFSKQNIKVDMSTFYFAKNNQLFTKSTGFIELCKELKFPWNGLIVARFIPLKLRDYCYDFIAKRRRKIADEYCYVPSFDERKRFINDTVESC